MNELFVIIDAGHGVDTPGKRSSNIDGYKLYEWEFNRIMQNKLVRKLYEFDIDFATLPNTVFDLDLDSRVAAVNRIYNTQKATHSVVLLSLHGNAFFREDPRGSEVYTYVGDTEADKLAEAICNMFDDSDMTRLRTDMADGDKDKEAHFVILRDTIPPAVLIEFGFYTNPEERRFMFNNDWQEGMTELLYNGLLNYYY